MSAENGDTPREEVTDLEDVVRSEAVQNRENFERNIYNLWGHSEVGLEAKRAAMTMLSTKTGMYARIPLICKADSCPYADNCPMIAYDLAPLGEVCPVEAAQIELRYAEYDKQFSLDDASFTDRNLVSEIINLDIMSERCKALMSKEQVPVVDVVAGISEQGVEYTRPEVSKYWEAYEKTLRRRGELLQLMMATRRDNKDKIIKEKSILEIISEVSNGGGFVIDERPDHIVDVEGERI